MGVRFYVTMTAGDNTCVTFGKDALDAQQELYKRAYVDGREDGLDREHIIWSTMKNSFGTDVNRVATNRPVSTQEAVIVEQRNTKTLRNEGMYPIMPLKYVKLEGDTKKTMTVGTSEPISHLAIKGYNQYNTEYIKFNALAGHWIVTDSNGKALTGDNAPVIISTGKNPMYTAVRPGKC